ncbi:hypothetical protein HPB47_000351 [Ixodes persulcatus]|uniref:Uncharacterized protein n=1 Tax=Ixodes persulcatus TaxID=34615 RepID=A0AC60PS66_IXOPE|nr:hypothetical protein HPB47_000351 [Ixodes persulcatus]
MAGDSLSFVTRNQPIVPLFTMPVVKCLRGYCDILNFRPIHFQETLPEDVCCSVCDVIPELCWDCRVDTNTAERATTRSPAGSLLAVCLTSAKLRSAASYASDPFNVAGYTLQVGQTFVRRFADQLYVYLTLLTSVRRTTENSSQWPIRKTFFLILVHPEDPGKNIKHAIMPSEVEHVDVYFTRIQNKTNRKIQKPQDKCFKTSELQSVGFVVDDALRVIIEAEG